MGMSLVKVFTSFNLIVFVSQSIPHLQLAINNWSAEVRPYIKRVQQSVLTDGTVIMALFYEKQSLKDLPDESEIRYLKGDNDAYEA